MYYLYSENKEADQMGGYHSADHSSLFSHMQKAGFLRTPPVSAQMAHVYN